MSRINKILVYTLLILISLSACTSRNDTDIAKILSPYLLPDLKKTKIMRISSQDSLGNTSISLPAGKSYTLLNIAGPGIVTRLWFDIGTADATVLRQILIRMYWDDEDTPSVEVPFCDFFGCGYGYHEFYSQMLNMMGGSYSCFFPMPFEDNARIELVNESSHVISGVTFQVDYHKIETYLSRDVGYFHAMWKRDLKTDYDSNYTILNTRGRGHIVGVNLNIQSYNGRFDYLSGKESIFVDGEKRPSIVGTGTIDYFMGGSGGSLKTFQTPVSGLILKDDSLGRISAYRYHLSDAISFKKSVVFSIEHGRDNQDIADYSSTVYWYQLEPHKHMPPIAKPAQRIPLRTVTSNNLYEAENLQMMLGKIKTRIEDMSVYGPEWSGSKQLVLETVKGSDFSVRFTKLEESSYDAEIYYTKGPSFGNADVYIDNDKAGEIRGYAPDVIPGGKLIIKNISNPVYTFDIRFVIKDKDSLSSGYEMGIDGINLVPKRFFIPEWKVSGPYEMSLRERRKSQNVIDVAFSPENSSVTDNPDRKMKLPSWQIVKPEIDGYLSLDKFIKANEPVVVYAETSIFSPKSAIMYLYVGSDDAVKVFFNEKQVYRYSGRRFAEPDQGQIFLRIQKGWNKLVIKVANQSGNSGIFARILDREKILQYSADKK